MSKKLKLFVWEEVLTDYTDGLAVALAYDVEEARQLLMKKMDRQYVHPDLEKEPKVIEGSEAFYVYGGG